MDDQADHTQATMPVPVDLSAITSIQLAGRAFDQAGAAIASMSATPDGDLARQMVTLDLAGAQVDISAKVLQAQDETTESLMDIVA
jgi:hypothetical protein